MSPSQMQAECRDAPTVGLSKLSSKAAFEIHALGLKFIFTEKEKLILITISTQFPLLLDLNQQAVLLTGSLVPCHIF